MPRAGTALENPFVYDAAAREIKEHARRGRVEIVDEVHVPVGAEQIVSRLAFRRLR